MSEFFKANTQNLFMLTAIDFSLFNFFHSVSNQFKLLDWFIIFVAQYLPYFLVIVYIFFLFKEKDFQTRFYHFSFTALAIVLSRGIFTEIIRFFYHRSRPFLKLDFIALINHPSSYSFPSGHAVFYFTLAILFFLFKGEIWQRWRFWFLGGVILMGIARVMAGVHWPLDIVTGFLVAAVSVFMIKWLLRKYSTLITTA